MGSVAYYGFHTAIGANGCRVFWDPSGVHINFPDSGGVAGAQPPANFFHGSAVGMEPHQR